MRKIEEYTVKVEVKVNVRASEGNVCVIDLPGEIDIYTSPKVRDATTELIDQGHYHLVINLEKVRYIGSTGLGVLVGGLKRVREHGGSFRPHGPRENLWHLR